MVEQGQYTVPIPVDPGSATGWPIYFTHGPFAGKTIRTSTAEVQKADLGRKFARKDKRPLDPPPVVEVRFFEVVDAGTSWQGEKEITTFENYTTPALLVSSEQEYGTPATLPDNPASDIIAYYEDYPITAASNATPFLAGTRVTTANILSHTGGGAIVFAFSDLAVREEGTFTLRYRTFHIFSKTTDDGGLSYRIPLLSSCFGGVFKIWPTRSFPGLGASTALTQRLSFAGAPVHIRQPEHRIGKRKKTQETSGPQLECSGSAGSASVSPQRPWSHSASPDTMTSESAEDRDSLSPSPPANVREAQIDRRFLLRPESGPWPFRRGREV